MPSNIESRHSVPTSKVRTGSGSSFDLAATASLMLAPIAVLGRSIAGSYFTYSFMLTALAGAIAIATLMAGGWRITFRRHALVIALLPFLMAALLSWAVSPFGLGNFKAFAQLGGIVATMAMMIGLCNMLSGRPESYFALVSLILRSLSWIGGLALVQFFINNALGANVIDFSGLNIIAGDVIISSGSMLGGLWRATALCSEPSHLGAFMAVGVGPAALRLGVGGRALRLAISPVLSRTAAALIIGGLVTTLSSVAFAAAGLSIAALWLFNPRVSFARSLSYAGVALALIGGVVGLTLYSDSAITSKLFTLSLISEAAQDRRIEKLSADDVTAIAIATNFVVMQQNLREHPLLGVGIGSHPLAFATNDLYVFKTLPEAILKLNSQDAASLAIRILSEMGILGLATFLLFVGFMVTILRRVIVGLSLRVTADHRYLVMVAIGCSLAASTLGETIASLARMGYYFGGPLWMAVVLVAPLPALYGVRPAAQKATSAQGYLSPSVS